MLMLLAISHRVDLFRCLQHTNEIYKICVLIYLRKPDAITLTSFSTNNLLEVIGEVVVQVYCEGIFDTALLSIYSFNVV